MKIDSMLSTDAGIVFQIRKKTQGESWNSRDPGKKKAKIESLIPRSDGCEGSSSYTMYVVTMYRGGREDVHSSSIVLSSEARSSSKSSLVLLVGSGLLHLRTILDSALPF